MFESFPKRLEVLEFPAVVVFDGKPEVALLVVDVLEAMLVPFEELVDG